MKKSGLSLLCFSLLSILLVTCKTEEVTTLEELVPDGLVTTLNPSGISPLTAEISGELTKSMSWSYSVLGSYPISQRSEQPDMSVKIPVLGLYPNTENQVEIVFEDSKGIVIKDTVTIKTDSIPTSLPDISILKIDTTAMHKGMHLCDFSYGVNGKFHSNPFVFDNDGIIRWYLDLSALEKWSAPMNFNTEGNLIFGSQYNLYEYDLLGNQINSWDVDPYFVHHEVIEIPGGNIIAAVGKKDTYINNGKEMVSSGDDFIIEFDTREKKVVNEWDLRAILDVDRPGLSNDIETGDWYHMNAIEYSPSDSTLIISGKHQGVVKVDWDNNLKWIFAAHKGWGKSGINGEGFETRDYLLNAVGLDGTMLNDSIQQGFTSSPNFDWPWSQHAPVLDKDGDLFLFDNGLMRNFDKTPTYSRLVEYRIKDEERTVEQIWDYGADRGRELFSAIISDVDLLDNGNVLGTFGFLNQPDKHYARIIELSYPDNKEYFEAELIFKDQFGNGYLAWGQIDILYRSERIDFNKK